MKDMFEKCNNIEITDDMLDISNWLTDDDIVEFLEKSVFSSCDSTVGGSCSHSLVKKKNFKESSCLDTEELLSNQGRYSEGMSQAA